MQAPDSCGEKKHQSRAWPLRERRHRNRLFEGYRDRNIQRRRLAMKQSYLDVTLDEHERQRAASLQAFHRALTSEDKALLKQVKVNADPQPTLAERFHQEAEKWNRETEHLSSPLQRMMHPSYQAILGMAREHKQDIIRLMLRDMQKTRRDWLLALSYLTQENPINPKDAGKTDRLIQTWIRWGMERGLI